MVARFAAFTRASWWGEAAVPASGITGKRSDEDPTTAL